MAKKKRQRTKDTSQQKLIQQIGGAVLSDQEIGLEKNINKQEKTKVVPEPIHTHRKRRLLLFIFSLILILVVSLSAMLFFVLKDIPSPKTLSSGQFAVSTHIYDRNSTLLYDIYADQNRTPVKLADLPVYVKQATISIEDKNFYHHFGIDFTGVLRAFLTNLTGRRLEGGSTITQQLVKIALLTPKRDLPRKIREAALAIVTETLYTKDQILEMYMNFAPYGGTAYGIEQASRLYFNASAKNLSLPQAAFLAGLPQAPTRYSPFGSYPELANERKKEVLRRMREDGYINKDQEQKADDEELAFASPNVPIRAPHFVLWVKDLLVNQYGEQVVERGGLRVTTTLDLPLQEKAEASVSAELSTLAKLKVGNGAALVTNPGTGEILSMVGSRDYFDLEHHGNVNVTMRPRQPGSSIKPLMYASGFSTGKLTPSTMWLDIPTCFKVLGQPDYCPKNYDGKFHGPQQIRFALGNSYNIPAVKSLAFLGVDDMIATASAMGITTFTDPSRYGLSLTLGGGEVTMADMATAFGTLANNGVRVPLNPFLKIEDFKGNVLYERPEADRRSALQKMFDAQKGAEGDESSGPTPSSGQNEGGGTLQPTFPEFSQLSQAIPPEAAYLISHILLDNNARASAFGSSSKLSIPNQVVSVKTGTTNDLKDNWTFGYTPERLTAVWVGNNDGSAMNQALVSGVTGAAPIWNDIMRFVLKDRKSVWPEKPDGVVGRDVCAVNGKLPTPDAPCDTRHEFFWEKFLPDNNGPSQKDIVIRKDTSLPVDPNIPLDQQGETELQSHAVLSDPLVTDFCMDCTWPTTQDLNPDGSVKETHVSYPISIIDMQKIHPADKSKSVDKSN